MPASVPQPRTLIIHRPLLPANPAALFVYRSLAYVAGQGILEHYQFVQSFRKVKLKDHSCPKTNLTRSPEGKTVLW